jgi:hypothetical protein
MVRMTSAASSYEGHLKAIGLITVNYVLLENTLAAGIWSFLELDQMKGQIVTAELSFKGLVALFSSLYRNRRSDLGKIKELEKLLKKIMRAEETRNIICHSLWAAGATDQTLSRIKTTAKVLSKSHPTHRTEAVLSKSATLYNLRCVNDKGRTYFLDVPWTKLDIESTKIAIEQFIRLELPKKADENLR